MGRSGSTELLAACPSIPRASIKVLPAPPGCPFRRPSHLPRQFWTEGSGVAKARPHAGGRRRAWGRETSTALLFLSPLFLLVLGLNLYPFCRAIWLSFTD